MDTDTDTYVAEQVVTGISVNMAIFTGPHYPNKTTPYHERRAHANKVTVPSFACSMPVRFD